MTSDCRRVVVALRRGPAMMSALALFTDLAHTRLDKAIREALRKDYVVTNGAIPPAYLLTGEGERQARARRDEVVSDG